MGWLYRLYRHIWPDGFWGGEKPPNETWRVCQNWAGVCNSPCETCLKLASVK